MTRKLKAASVVLAAVFALTAVGASSATAAESLLTPAVSPAFVEGEQLSKQVWKLTGMNAANAVSVTCTTSTLKATVENTTIGGVTGVREVTAAPSYIGCLLAGVNANISVHNCVFTLTSSATALSQKVDITNCPSTAPFEIVASSTGCIVTIENQGPLSENKLSNNAGMPDDVTVTLNTTGIKFTGNSSCPANIVGTFSNGDLASGSYTVRAYKDEAGSKGAQVNLTAD